jgi:hypothetical protein
MWRTFFAVQALLPQPFRSWKFPGRRSASAAGLWRIFHVFRTVEEILRSRAAIPSDSLEVIKKIWREEKLLFCHFMTERILLEMHKSNSSMYGTGTVTWDCEVVGSTLGRKLALVARARTGPSNLNKTYINQ